MTQLIRSLIIFLFPVFAHANHQIDQDCINHLGGAFAGVECYNSLAEDMAQKNKAIANEILSKIPRKNINRAIFKKYIAAMREGESFCHLKKNAYAQWHIENQNKGPRYFDYDVVYFECIYNKKQEEYRFMSQLLDYMNQ